MSGIFIGKTIEVAQALPATNDSAGFAALTYTKVNGVQILPTFGLAHNNIDRDDLESGFTEGLKGAASGTDSTMTFRDVDGDAGQALLKAAANASGISGDLSVKIVDANGNAEEYAQGYAHSFTPNQGDNSSYEGFTVNFKQNAVSVEA